MRKTPHMMAVSNLKLDFEPSCLLEYSSAKDAIEKHGVSIPFPVVKRDTCFLIKGRELFFLACLELNMKKVPVVMVEDERLFDRQSISTKIGPQDNPLDASRRIRLYQTRYDITQTQLGQEFDVSQSLVSRYLRLTDYLYPQTIRTYQRDLKIADQTRNHRHNPTSRMGASDIGFRHLYELTRLHHKYSRLSQKRSRELQTRMMNQMTTKCPSVANLNRKICAMVHQDPTQSTKVRGVSGITVFNADSRFLLNVIDEGSVHLVVTSPPYNLDKPYEVCRTLEEHLENIIPPLQSAAKALCSGGWYFLNIVDYKVGPNEYLPIRDVIIYALRECGMQFVSPSVWAKKMVKNLDGRNERRTHTNYRILQNLEYILAFRKKGEREIDQELADLSKAQIVNDSQLNEWNHFSAVMNFNTSLRGDGPEGIGNAIMPSQLAEFLVRAYSLIGDTVLDPFAGSGTTLEASEESNRQSVGFEISPQLCKKYFKPYVCKKAIPRKNVALPMGWRNILDAIIDCINPSLQATAEVIDDIC